MPYQVPISLHPILRDPPFVIVLFWLGTALGYRLLQVCRVPFEGTAALERGVLCAAIGLGLLQYLPFGLGMTSHLTPRALWIGLLVLLAVFAFDMFVVARGLWRALVRRLPRMLSSSTRWIVTGLFLLAIPLTLAFLKALTPPTDPDGIGYHLTAAKRWLQSGHLGYLPTLAHTNGPMGVDMLYTLALGVWSDTAAKLTHYGFGVLALLSIFALGRRFRNVHVGFAAAALWLLGPHKESTIQQFSWAYVELASTTQIVCMALAWLLWRRERHPGWLLAAILCAGFAMTTKLTNAFAGGALAIMVMGTLLERRRGIPVVLRAGAVVAALTLAPVVPWLIRSWTLTGNPVYPVLSSVFPTRDWSAETVRAFKLYFKYYNWGEMLSRRLNLSQRITLCYAAQGLLAITAAVVGWRWKDAEARVLVIATAAMALFTIQTTGLYLRFFLPLLALIYVLICAAMARALVRRLRVRALLLLLLLFRAGTNVWEERPTLPTTLGAATGRIPRAQFLRSRQPGLFDTWEFANQRLEPRARILVGPMVAYAHGATYYCDRYCFITDAYLQYRIRMDNWDQFLSDVRRDRIGYVVVQTPVPYSHAGPSYAPAINEEPFVNRLAHDYGRPIFVSGYFTLYRLRDRM